MIAVYKKELSLYVRTMQGYLFVSGFLLGGALLFTAHNVLGGSMDLKPVWHGMLYVLAALTPLLTMRLIAAERERRTDALLLSAPVTVGAVTAAKFFAALTVLAFSLCVSLLYPLILSLFGPPAWGRILTGLLGVLLFGALLIAAGLFVSSLLKRTAPALMATYGVMLLMLLVDSSTAWLKSGLFKTAALWAQPLSNAAYFIGGFINLPSIVYFLSLTALLLFLAARSIERLRWSRGRRP